MNDEYLIWSIEHDAWWGPNETGYTTVTAQAGRYTRDRAAAIVQRANIPCPPDRPNEVYVPAPAKSRVTSEAMAHGLNAICPDLENGEARHKALRLIMDTMYPTFRDDPDVCVKALSDITILMASLLLVVEYGSAWQRAR